MIPELMLYLIKVNIALILFYAGYHFVLKRFTFYSLNRFYLLLGLTYSTFYPFIDLSALLNSKQIADITPQWQGSITYVITQTRNANDTYWQIGLVIFWTGVLFMALRLLTQLISLRIMHKQSHPASSGKYKFRTIKKALNPFSFWQTIYINSEYHKLKELQPILEHEQVHVQQLHTLDVLAAELCTIFYWFNPGVWLMKKAIKSNLEFITDQQVLRSGIDSKEYQYALLKINILPQNSLPVNNFHFLTLKKRIVMMNKKPSNQTKKSTYLLFIPAIMLMALIITSSKAALNKGTLTEVINKLPDLPAISDLKSSLPFGKKDPSEDLSAAAISSDGQATTDTNKTKKVKNTVTIATENKLTPVTDSIKNSRPEPKYIINGIAATGIGHINPEDILSVNVLKGHSATTIYGAEGRNGVVSIVTKPFRIAPASKTHSIKAAQVNMQQSQKISLSDISNELILLDGKEVSKSALNDLSVMSIAEIEVIKGAEAVHKYGEKGREGVVLINTKK